MNVALLHTTNLLSVVECVSAAPRPCRPISMRLILTSELQLVLKTFLSTKQTLEPPTQMNT